MEISDFIDALAQHGHTAVELGPAVAVLKPGKERSPYRPEDRLAFHTRYGIASLYPDRLPALLHALDVARADHVLSSCFE